MNTDQIIAIRKFVQGFKECLASKGQDSEMVKIALQYVNDLINIHLQLAELEFENYARQMEREVNQCQKK